MCPTIQVFGVSFQIFPFVMLAAVYTCIYVSVFSGKYDDCLWGILKKSVIYVGIGSVLGGKILYFLTRWQDESATIFSMLNGFVFYGGLIGMLVGLIVFCRREKISFVDCLDVFLSVLPLGQAIGRIGCYLNGCCYGMEYYGIFSVRYPVNGVDTRVFPTWFFEAAFCLLLFATIFSMSGKLYAGFYSGIYILSYAGFRFLIEFFRGDSIRGVWGGLSTSQIISIAMLVPGTAFVIFALRKKTINTLIKERE